MQECAGLVCASQHAATGLGACELGAELDRPGGWASSAGRCWELRVFVLQVASVEVSHPFPERGGLL